LTPERGNQEYDKAGTLFYNLDMMMYEINVFSRFMKYVQSRTERKIQRTKIKVSHCYEQEECQWKALMLLGVYDK
jgi:hypothetical protein